MELMFNSAGRDLKITTSSLLRFPLSSRKVETKTTKRFYLTHTNSHTDFLIYILYRQLTKQW